MLRPVRETMLRQVLLFQLQELNAVAESLRRPGVPSPNVRARLVGLRRSILWNAEPFAKAAWEFVHELDSPEDAFAPAFVFVVLGQPHADAPPEIRLLAEKACALSQLPVRSSDLGPW
jgi:hypothetical protein